jgi:hypothetical protein
MLKHELVEEAIQEWPTTNKTEDNLFDLDNISSPAVEYWPG